MATAVPSDFADSNNVDNDQILARPIALLGSLKLTVTLFAFSLVIVLVGTLAQDEMNMFDVKPRYFPSWIAWLHLDDLLPQAFFPHDKPVRGIIPFPGGALIGFLLLVNLVAAKMSRFRIKATAGRLVAGLIFMLAGVLVGGAIIFSGHSSDGLQGSPPEWLGYSGLWNGFQAALGLACVTCAFRFATAKHRTIQLLAATIGLVCLLMLYLAFVGTFTIGEPGLRIVWQLTKGLGAGLILMVGCILLFDKQGGNMLLHLGVGLLMLGQFVFGDRQLEQRLSLIEGQSSNALVNLDKVELSFINQGDAEDTVTAIPGSRLQSAFENNSIIQDPNLPVDVKVLAFYENSGLGDPKKDNPATVGIGKEMQAVERRKSGGVDSDVNIASAYVELIDKDSGKVLGTHLVSQRVSDIELLLPGERVKDHFDEVTIGDTEYKLGLRYHREVKPYWVQLEDVRRTDYSGTSTPRDYSSFIRIINPETGDDRRERVWMNNPLRYRGETFFQSSYTALPGGKELTGLQVVRNSGWLIPYVACSITALGMLVHFLMTLNRFLNRRERELRNSTRETLRYKGAVWAVVGVYALLVFAALQPWKSFSYGDSANTVDEEKFDFANCGAIPLQFGGRVMPLDTYARQTLKAMSNRESLSMEDAPSGFKKRVGEDAKKMTALQWLFEIAVDERKMRSLQMFRIDAEEVRAEFEVPRRESKLYSLDEISKNIDRVTQLVKIADKKEMADRTFKEKKLIEFDLRTRNYTLAAAAFQLPIPTQYPKEFFPEGWSLERRQMFAIQELDRKLSALENMRAPNIIPPEEAVARDAVDDPAWAPFSLAFFRSATSGSDDDPPPGIDTYSDMLQAYDDNDKKAFNEAVNEHLATVQAFSIPGYDARSVSLERWTQVRWPTGVAKWLYVAMLVLGLVYILANIPHLRVAVWGMLIVTFAVHTLAIACRIYITGRAPVINIYSSAVFVGWAAVGFCLIIEALFKRGIGNVFAATVGMQSLMVAYGLSKNTGDTMPVLQAVLDTQFWLTTHVISVSLGYVATLVAGFFGIGFLIANWFGANKKIQQEIYRCCYGTACFGILFSFVGTLLGGLWADDSWGRFWGWDPKENGALLIVIWNALMLHARWDGMVKARGFSILAIGGNIVTAWSWFGTNELGIGLHSYGFTSGVLMWLSVFIATQFAMIFAGLAIYRTPPMEFTASLATGAMPVQPGHDGANRTATTSSQPIDRSKPSDSGPHDLEIEDPSDGT